MVLCLSEIRTRSIMMLVIESLKSGENATSHFDSLARNGQGLPSGLTLEDVSLMSS